MTIPRMVRMNVVIASTTAPSDPEPRLSDALMDWYACFSFGPSVWLV